MLIAGFGSHKIAKQQSFPIARTSPDQSPRPQAEHVRCDIYVHKFKSGGKDAGPRSQPDPVRL